MDADNVEMMDALTALHPFENALFMIDQTLGGADSASAPR
jgi:hypothetical protein